MLELGIWRAAHEMIDLHDLDAGWRAGLRAEKLLEDGGVDGFHVWVRITKAIKEAQDAEPREYN